jgi:hypothetical protein
MSITLVTSDEMMSALGLTKTNTVVVKAKDEFSNDAVMYERLDGGKELSIADLAEMLLSGRNVILLGEYGTGKSRCVRELFNTLAESWDLTFQFPFAVNLRECWGLDRGDEIVRRGTYVLGLDDASGAPSALSDAAVCSSRDQIARAKL